MAAIVQVAGKSPPIGSTSALQLIGRSTRSREDPLGLSQGTEFLKVLLGDPLTLRTFAKSLSGSSELRWDSFGPLAETWAMRSTPVAFVLPGRSHGLGIICPTRIEKSAIANFEVRRLFIRPRSPMSKETAS